MTDENGDYVKDDYTLIEDGHIDLTPYSNELYDLDYQMEIIVGSGTPLDSNNIRYVVNVYTSMVEYITYDVYEKDLNGNAYKLSEEGCSSEAYDWLEDVESPSNSIPITAAAYMSKEYKEGTEYYLSINSSITSGAYADMIQLDIYKMSGFMEYFLKEEYCKVPLPIRF